MWTHISWIHLAPGPLGPRSWTLTQSESLLTFVIRQISEIHRLTDFLVRGSAQLHVHGDRFYDGGVVVSWSLEDDGDLPVNIGLGEGAFGLPAVGGEESHLDVIWRMMGDDGRRVRN